MQRDPYTERARAAHARGESLTIRQMIRLGLRLWRWWRGTGRRDQR